MKKKRLQHPKQVAGRPSCLHHISRVNCPSASARASYLTVDPQSSFHMLSAIRRAPSAQPTAKNVCIFCQRQPVTSLRNIVLSRHFTNTVLNSTINRAGRTSLNPGVTKSFLRDASTVSRKAEASAELIKEIRTEIEAHRQGLQKKGKSKEGEKRKPESKKKLKEGEKKNEDDGPKAPPVRRKTRSKV